MPKIEASDFVSPLMEINLGFTWAVLGVVLILVACAIKECCERKDERKKRKMIELGQRQPKKTDTKAEQEKDQPSPATHRNLIAIPLNTEANMLDRNTDNRKIEDAIEEVEEEEL